MIDYCDKDSWVSIISTVSGVLSLGSWMIAQFPQCYEIYQTKSVDGISPLFIFIWVIGDLANFLGCILTNQLFFQYILASYFLFCDLILVSQYWYYGSYLKNKAHHHQHHHRHHLHQQNRTRSGNSLSNTAAALVIASNVATASALPLTMGAQTPLFTIDAGRLISWFGSGCYFFARIPQLIKNYQRKSTEDISPFLFGCTLVGNLTYTISILFSCQFIYGDERWTFFMNELPFIIGSGGTIFFDILYFYQLWLYSDKSSGDSNVTEETPLLTAN